MFERNIKQKLEHAIGDTPVVMLVGARQVGKSTFVQGLSIQGYEPQYLTFDDPTVLAAAKQDPTAFIENTRGPVIFDEIQRVPELLLPIKLSVDRDRRPGAFLLTGSANVLLLPKVADSLAGRMEVLTMRTLSQGEIIGFTENFIDRVAADEFHPAIKIVHDDRSTLFGKMLIGGYPEALARKAESRRSTWFESYLSTLLFRDVRDLANIDGLADMSRLASILAARSGGMTNFSDISRSIGMPQTTLKRYISLFEQLFIVEHLPAYSGSLIKRVLRSPKLYFSDSGLFSNLQGLSWEKIKFENTLAGMLMENFVYSEIKKQTAWNQTRVRVMHYRTSSGHEVDLVLELPSSEIIGIEIKSAAAVDGNAFKGLKVLAEDVGKKFKRGIVIYTGEKSVAFADNMFAVPVETLWTN